MEESNRQIKVIGITGGIGSGKSSVAKCIEEFGYPIYFSDDRAKSIVNENASLILSIKELLGEEAYQGGVYNKKYIGSIVFNNSELLQSLNQLIHPAVALDFNQWLASQTNEFAFKETALLFELGLEKKCYKSLLVTADDNLRIKRVMDRDGKTYREVENIIEKQMSEKEKIRKANDVIYNNSTLENLKIQTELYLQKLQKLT